MPARRNKKRTTPQPAPVVERSAAQPSSTPSEAEQPSNDEARVPDSSSEPATSAAAQEPSASGDEQLAAENAALREQVASLQAQLAAAHAELAQQSAENRGPSSQPGDGALALSSKFEALQQRVKEADEKRASSWRELKGVLEDLNACAQANAATETLVE